MPLFQQAVIRKYIADLPKQSIEMAWLVFKGHFHNPVIQQNIRNAKEEQYQEGFLRELFVAVFGYTLNPQPAFNLTTEYKNEKDSKKADGAILHAGQVLAIIELKGTETTDLGKVESQAFNYKNNQKTCTYVITSNFEKLRFYINDAVEWEEFDLFSLSPERFALLYVCLHKDNLLSDVPLQMKQASAAAEENITRKLYADYSQFKKKLFQNIATINPQHDKLLLFKKTQKLLDRFLFIFFAEDRLLLPPNSVREILKQWEQLKELDNYVPLYERFKKYFGYLNTGHKGKLYEIFAYNGGLFAQDDLLDSILIDDEILYASCVTLSNYNFESEVDVNILGHIFEHSLNEIEELEKSLLSAADDNEKSLLAEPAKAVKTTSRRKKDGVFYTPRYITKYIVENTIGTLCIQQKETLGIVEDEFTVVKRKANRKQLLDKIESYREWLLQLTICDPACGSGAFLNQALEFLIAEHRYVDELKAKLFGDAMVLSDVENVILENNLFGVDINDEAVEIARLSLWLRTAKKGRKLNRLTNNIQSGNSLIDDPAIAGDKAFNWKEAFPAIFEKRGFDVVIGNPPYVDIKGLDKSMVDELFRKFVTANNRINLFTLFIEKSLSVLRPGGKFSFIVPSSILNQESYKEIRKVLLENTSINAIVRLPNESFGAGSGEVKVDTIILTFSFMCVSKSSTEVVIYKGFDRITEIASRNSNFHFFAHQDSWKLDDYIFRINVDDSINQTIDKIEKNAIRFGDCADFCLGLTPYDKYKGHSSEQILNRAFHANYKKDETYKKLLAGFDINRYYVNWSGEEWISYGKWLGASRELKFFTESRLLVKQIIDWSDKRIWAAITKEELYNTQNAFNILANKEYKIEYLGALLNSRLMSFYHRKKFLDEYKDRFQKILIKECKEFPIKKISFEHQQEFVVKVNQLIETTKQFHVLGIQFVDLLKSNFDNLSITRRIGEWPSLTFGELIKELDKQKIKLTLSQQAEWMPYFEEQKAKAQEIQKNITATDKEIDKMVYALYELTEEEIALVEGS